jgi:hypothetical protein
LDPAISATTVQSNSQKGLKARHVKARAEGLGIDTTRNYRPVWAAQISSTQILDAKTRIVVSAINFLQLPPLNA